MPEQGKPLFFEITTPDFCNFLKKHFDPFLNSPVFPVNWQRHVRALARTPFCVWGRYYTCHMEPPQTSGLVTRRIHTSTEYECEASLGPSVRRTFCRACLGKFMWYLLDVRPLYCRLAMSTCLAFSVDQQLRADAGRGVGHTIIWLALVFVVWGQDCISYSNKRLTLNLPLCVLGVLVSDFKVIYKKCNR